MVGALLAVNALIGLIAVLCLNKRKTRIAPGIEM
jgi:hypothetical protein